VGVELVNVMDVSNYQPADLHDLIQEYNIDHVIIRTPQRVERQSLHIRAQEQILSVLAEGKTVGMYYWLYKDVDIRQQVDDVTEFWRVAQVTPPLYWPDIEPYQTNDNLPSIEQIKKAARIHNEYEQLVGIYTGPWVWSLLRNVVDPDLLVLPLWTAEYNHIPTLEDVNLYGGWTHCVGHQYSADNNIDLSVFDKRYTILS
jgi:hypothetical protein